MARRKTPPGIRIRRGPAGTRYQLRWVDSEGVRQSATFDHLDDALAAQEQRTKEMRFALGARGVSGRTLYGDWYEHWNSTREIRDSTADRDASYARNHILPKWSETALIEIHEDDVRAWVTGLMTKAKLAPATAAKILAQFNRSLKAATGPNRALLYNPAAEVEPPKVHWQEARFLLPEELIHLEAQMDEHWRLIVPFMADTGLRIGEVAALRVSDVNILGHKVSVTKTATIAKRSDGSRRQQDGPPKSSAGYRVVPTLSDEVANRLAAMILERGLGPKSYLFSGEKGAQMSLNNWRRRVFKPAVVASGFDNPQPKPHSLRHTAVAHWLAAGEDPYRVARWAGHRSASSLQRLYGHLLPDDATETRQRLGQIRDRAAEAYEQSQKEGEVLDLDKFRDEDF